MNTQKQFQLLHDACGVVAVFAKTDGSDWFETPIMAWCLDSYGIFNGYTLDAYEGLSSAGSCENFLCYCPTTDYSGTDFSEDLARYKDKLIERNKNDGE